MNTGVASRTATGWMTSIVPTPVPTPRPLRNPAKTDQIAPATAAAPHRTSTRGSPVTNRASSTGNAPLSRSPATTTAAHAVRALAAHWSRRSAPSRSSAGPRRPPAARPARRPGSTRRGRR